MRYMSLDVGDRRIGIAATDPLGWTVQPVETLERSRPERDFAEIAGLIQDMGVRMVVVGLPLRTERSEVGIQATKVLAFTEQLAAYCRGLGLTVQFETWDESLTTKEARGILERMGVKRKKRNEAVDQMAAILILQSFLSERGE